MWILNDFKIEIFKKGRKYLSNEGGYCLPVFKHFKQPIEHFSGDNET